MSSTRADWRAAFPRGVTDPYGPSGEPVFTAVDRRLLWHIEVDLAPSSDAQRDLCRVLSAYLHETCEHHWNDSEVSEWRHPDTSEVMDRIPAHRQCLWCNKVEWAADPESRAAS